MQLSPSAYVDTFCRDNLPPQSQWPEFLFDLPDVQYPDRLNCAVELLDSVIAQHGSNRPCLRSADGEVWSYEDLRRRSDQIANVLTNCKRPKMMPTLTLPNTGVPMKSGA